MKCSALDNWIMETEALPKLTREGLDAIQLKKLNETLVRLHQRGGIYKDYPLHLSSLKDLQNLPFTTQEMLSANPGQFLITSQSQVSRVISGATSGTTGPAKRVFYTETDTDHTVGFFAAGISEMLTSGEKCLICFPFSGPFGLGDLIAKAVENLGAYPVRAGYGQTWQEICDIILKTRPQTYIGFPVSLLSIARVYGKDFPIHRALVSGDACPAGVMEALEQIMGNRLYPHYGSRECGLGGAVTCQAFEGMHFRENHIIPEIIDENGHRLPDGAYGELVITTIGLDAMPLIRYRTGDYTRILPPCPCGSVTRRIDMVTRKELPLSICDLDSLLFSVPELIDYQAFLGKTLHIQACMTDTAVLPELLQRISSKYPGLSITGEANLYNINDRPMYPGKRHILKSQ